MHTQVAILGAGPAGLFLSHLLHLQGIDSVVIESRSRDYVEGRLRAGVLEKGTVDALVESGVGERLLREGLRHKGFNFRFGGRNHVLDLADLADGKHVTVYGQQEVVKDLIAARIAAAGKILFNVEAKEICGIDTARPTIRVHQDGEEREISCELVAGCDGFHGISRPAIPADILKVFDRVYPFSWLGILAEAPPVSDYVTNVYHEERGFALLSMRSRTLSRLYLQVDSNEKLEDWPDVRIWDELDRRLEGKDGLKLIRGPILQKGITPMRSFVAEPMSYRRLFLAGDAAHIVPPTGAKGMNMAIADIRVLAVAMTDFFKTGSTRLLDAYSDTCLRRVWKVERFSWSVTSMTHNFPQDSAFDKRMRNATLDYLMSSKASGKTFAENFVGLPLEESVVTDDERDPRTVMLKSG
ncbi:MAG: 4-hydroxybenzoate 3-monooxygenase [Pseudomonadota bacterium]